ncbi:sn-glycerol-3-phosphate-binding periplasmic protein UgpB [Fundidesulfovibrio magnetotacticus]|uniref:sn-glycerol-3-phosphate-binding periplasmic protein UgpB n=1 Tax=Fundidesulfovibrio magnetotacticus TaxID=2730080 RepID=A0A6V8LL83_9BACT|nr:ABC transporter substrate-binding protein [Fundidesulfovibrio magnetotacticus]GFK93443.1 sn-glycerol-3-phosphate-binding periplasmic protein UgpB [Fundidesulfovibrio magnetotacticus]
MLKQTVKPQFLVLAFALLLLLSSTALAEKVSLTFYFPVAVGGPITKVIEGMTESFMKENPDIKITPVYAGIYRETLTKALTALKGGEPPHVAVLLSTDMYTLIDEDAVVPYDEILPAQEMGFVKDYYPGFMQNSQTGGKTWGIPFQRSTIVMYWNKEAFKEAGLDPNTPPKTWTEMLDFAKKLTKKDASGVVSQWGVAIPTTGYAYWLFQALAIENGIELMNPAGTEVYFNKPASVEALQFLVDLSRKYEVSPKGTIDWATTPKDFFERKTAIMWTTTGNLTNVRNNAKFDFGVGMLPANKRPGSPTGGGNFYIFKKATPAERKAAVQFVKWMTTAERAAQWGIDTGYVAVRPDAWETKLMKDYVQTFPYAAVARDQLQHAVAELSTHENQRVTKALDDAIQAAVNGTKTPAEALNEAQAEAERILRRYKR